jgi:y4mF family transcriptional regulator
MELGAYIKQKRKLYGIVQKELAERSGVGLRFIKDLEAGKKTVRMDKVNQVLELLGEELLPRPICKGNEES